jgi:hypothetical protein
VTAIGVTEFGTKKQNAEALIVVTPSVEIDSNLLKTR